MPYDGTTQTALTSAEALHQLIKFFANAANWYGEDYCRRQGSHSYSRGRMCLGGALAKLCQQGAPDSIYRYVQEAIFRQTGRHDTLSSFNLRTTHGQLMEVLHEAHTMALFGTLPNTTAKETFIPKVKPRPTPADAPAEVILIDHLMSLFQGHDHELGRPTINQALRYFRSATGIHGDKTTYYLRRAFRRVPWTFGSTSAFDHQATHDQLIAMLQYARHLALDAARPPRGWARTPAISAPQTNLAAKTNPLSLANTSPDLATAIVRVRNLRAVA